MVSRRDLMHAMVNDLSDSKEWGDDAMCTAVSARLQTDLGLPPQVVEISVKEGFVTLNGKLDTPLDRDAARVAAESIPGVKGVSNNIQIDHHMSRRIGPAP